MRTKVLRVFSSLHSHLCSSALRFLFLHTHATSYSFYSLVTVHYKGEWRRTWYKPYPLPHCLTNPHNNPKSEDYQDYAQKPQQNCTFMNSASVLIPFPKLQLFGRLFFKTILTVSVYQLLRGGEPPPLIEVGDHATLPPHTRWISVFSVPIAVKMGREGITRRPLLFRCSRLRQRMQVPL